MGGTGTNIADKNCAKGVDKVSTTEYCTGSVCTDNDASKCCQQKCSDSFELFGGKTKNFLQCPKAGQRVSPDAYCTGPTCVQADDKSCCETKCDKSGAGFELFG